MLCIAMSLTSLFICLSATFYRKENVSYSKLNVYHCTCYIKVKGHGNGEVKMMRKSQVYTREDNRGRLSGYVVREGTLLIIQRRPNNSVLVC